MIRKTSADKQPIASYYPINVQFVLVIPMQSIDILMNGRRSIKRGLAIQGVMATRAECGKSIAADIVRSLLDFFKAFADQCHHHKEEELLLQA